jgi:hypothetical protein
MVRTRSRVRLGIVLALLVLVLAVGKGWLYAGVRNAEHALALGLIAADASFPPRRDRLEWLSQLALWLSDSNSFAADAWMWNAEAHAASFQWGEARSSYDRLREGNGRVDLAVARLMRIAVRSGWCSTESENLRFIAQSMLDQAKTWALTGHVTFSRT